MVDVVSAKEDVKMSIVVDPVVVLGLSEEEEEEEDVCSTEVSGVDVSPTVENVVSAVVENVDVTIVVD